MKRTYFNISGVKGCARMVLVAMCIVTTIVGAAPRALAEYKLNYRTELKANAGGGDFAPYYVMSNCHGLTTQNTSGYLRGSLWRPLDMNSRFSYAFGVDLVAGAASATSYLRYIDDTDVAVARRPANFMVQQLYGKIKYRGMFLTVGLQEHGSALHNDALSSGDLIEGPNARPIPEVRVGFVDFQDIPFTNGWLQIQGEISYGKFTDNAWLRNHYNYASSHLNQGALYTYKRCFFRTKSSQPLSATFGMQVGAMFGGETKWYENGRIVRRQTFSRGVKQFIKMFIPTDGGASYYSGSSLGSWDVLFRYRLNNGSQLKAYFQKPFEDGSGIGFLNGWDGVWGLEYVARGRQWLSGVVVEYLDFTNQSGPIHWDPTDHPGTGINKHNADGADDYYNNHEYNAYANFGMAIGSPFLVSPIYNLNGYMQFRYNRLRGFHVGVSGHLSGSLSYRLLGSYRRSWGNGFLPLLEPESDTSFMAEATWHVDFVPGMVISAQFAMDHGRLLGNNTGGAISVSYSGDFSL